MRRSFTIQVFYLGWYKLQGAILQLYLFVFRKNPSIEYFRCDPFIGVNDLTRTISWKVKNAWKTEIEEIGRVKVNDSVLFNNRKFKTQLKLIAFGRRGSTAIQLLELNLQRTVLSPVPEVTIDELQMPLPQQLQNQIVDLNNQLTEVFYIFQKQEDVERTLIQVSVNSEELNLPYDDLSKEMMMLDSHQHQYISERYHSTLKHYLHNQKLTLWTPEPHLITLSGAPKNSPG